MIRYLLENVDVKIIGFCGILFSYFLTFILLKTCSNKLPKDGGRDFAHDGKLSAGKPRGAGFIFVIVFSISALLFTKINREIVIYIILTLAAMTTGFLDDCAKAPWGEYKKGILDLIIAIMVAITFLNFNNNVIYIAIIGKNVTIPYVLFVILGVVLVWASINVTNCSDGVDGLSGTLSIITMLTIYGINALANKDTEFNYVILMFVICIMSYLWFNATPSKLMMGDAGSRAMGLFISIAILKTNSPLLYLLVALVLILDGGLGLVKVSLLRFLKIRIMKNIRTPLHDHVRKKLNWSNTQTVYRFAIIQIMVSLFVLWILF